MKNCITKPNFVGRSVLCVFSADVWENNFSNSNSTVDWFDVWITWFRGLQYLLSARRRGSALPFLMKWKFNWFFFLSLSHAASFVCIFSASLIVFAARKVNIHQLLEATIVSYCQRVVDNHPSRLSHAASAHKYHKKTFLIEIHFNNC